MLMVYLFRFYVLIWWDYTPKPDFAFSKIKIIVLKYLDILRVLILINNVFHLIHDASRVRGTNFSYHTFPFTDGFQVSGCVLYVQNDIAYIYTAFQQNWSENIYEPKTIKYFIFIFKCDIIFYGFYIFMIL